MNEESWFKHLLSHLKVFFSSPPPELDESHAKVRYEQTERTHRLQSIGALRAMLNKFFAEDLDLIVLLNGKRLDVTRLADDALAEIEYLNKRQERLMTREEWQEYERAKFDEACNKEVDDDTD